MKCYDQIFGLWDEGGGGSFLLSLFEVYDNNKQLITLMVITLTTITLTVITFLVIALTVITLLVITFMVITFTVIPLTVKTLTMITLDDLRSAVLWLNLWLVRWGGSSPWRCRRSRRCRARRSMIVGSDLKKKLGKCFLSISLRNIFKSQKLTWKRNLENIF
jgi:hypothetical protein